MVTVTVNLVLVVEVPAVICMLAVGDAVLPVRTWRCAGSK